MTWPEIAEKIAAHRSELERIETELRVLLTELPNDDDPRTRVVVYHLDYVLEDHLPQTLMGVGAAGRIVTSREAAARVAEATEKQAGLQTAPAVDHQETA